MKMFRALLAVVALTFFVGPVCAQRVNPVAPPLGEVLKLKNSQALIFRPTRIGKDYNVDVSHLRLARPVVRPNEKQFVQLVIYALKPNQAGGNDILFTDTQQVGDGSVNIANGTPNTILFPAFKPSATPAALPYIEQDNRVGIIAVLIGFRQIGTAPYQPIPLPAADTISVEVNPGDGGLGLLLPAVQKVRSAAARL